MSPQREPATGTQPADPQAGPGGARVPIDERRVSAWLAEHLPAARPPFTFELIAGGRSNLTFRVLDRDGGAYALRRPPVSHVLPTAHDMAREHRVISALGPTAVPVPATYDLCTDESVTGSPFYVMEFVEGHILRDAETAQGAFDEAGRRPIGDHLADSLADLHAVDVDAVGLGDLGRHQGYVERQLRRWSTQYASMAVDGVDHGGLIERVGAALAADIPPQHDAAVVHGDYRLDNVVLDDRGAVQAILDWEICTLGDPLADVGTLMVYWAEPDDGLVVLGRAGATTLPGFSSRAQVLERYAEASGRDLSDIDYFTAFGYWKLACILQGVYARYRGGAAGGDPNSVADFPTTIRRLAERAAELVPGGS